jgi:ammonia channel protein AmtB
VCSAEAWLRAAVVACGSRDARLHRRAAAVGGSITIHAFGAVYGLAASVFLSPKGGGAGHPKNGACYTSDITAMLGTLFLFIYWCGLHRQQRVFV